MVHISHWDATLGLIKGAARCFLRRHRFIFIAHTNAKGPNGPEQPGVQPSLRDSNPTCGLLNLEAVAAIAQSVGFSVPLSPRCPQMI